MRRLCVPLALALILVPLQQGRASAATLARTTADGWWDNAPAVVADPPQGSLGVGQSLGQSDRIAALAITLDVPVGTPVEALVLELKEVSSQVVAGPAALAACAIAAPWAPAKPGAWDARPQVACDRGKAAGSRADDGWWRFDITPLAQGWQSGAANHGVAIISEGASPATFDVALAGVASGDVILSGRAGDSAPDEPVARDDGGGTSEFGAPSDGGDFTLPPATLDVPRQSAPATPPPVPEPIAAPSSPSTPAAPSRNEGELAGNLSPVLLLLIPLALAAAAVLAMTLGPAGDPRTSRRRREGGVSRALAARDTEVK